ncbi:MAG: hypothetical protein B6D61_13105 [Bacteroidetes bacterium 4484_249]|nr:MAG: hypothetical protein B6D61_13105 [Bacteroidetes bacterium 4484_249]
MLPLLKQDVLKNSNEQTLKEAINELLKSYKLENGVNNSRLIKSWDDVTGDMISKHTEQIFIKKTTLYVKLDSPALKHELSFARSKLIKLLNKSVNRNIIEEIVFL